MYRIVKTIKDFQHRENIINLISGINTMSIMHDKWTDKNVGLFNGKLSDTPYLEMSIIPAIPTTYLGLIGETMNIFNIKTNLDDLSNIYNSNNLKPVADIGEITNIEQENKKEESNLIDQLRELNEKSKFLFFILRSKDINIMGADILAEKDNSNITLNAGNDINISTIQDYEYERQYSKQKGGTFGTTTTKENIKQSLTNIKSNITASNNLSITTGNDLTSIGTNFTAGATTSNHSPLEGESNEQGLDRSSFGTTVRDNFRHIIHFS